MADFSDNETCGTDGINGPEAGAGAGVGGRSATPDLWSVGCVLAEMLVTVGTCAAVTVEGLILAGIHEFVREDYFDYQADYFLDRNKKLVSPWFLPWPRNENARPPSANKGLPSYLNDIAEDYEELTTYAHNRPTPHTPNETPVPESPNPPCPNRTAGPESKFPHLLQRNDSQKTSSGPHD